MADEKIVISIPFSTFLKLQGILPASALVLCIVISMLKDFEVVNHTHCGVPNVFPSISAAVGQSTPQRYIWRLGIAMNSSLRLLSVLLSYIYFSRSRHAYAKLLGTLDFIVTTLGEFSLLGLTFVSSSENYFIHKWSFGLFILYTAIHMVLRIALLFVFRDRSIYYHQVQIYRWKVGIFAIFLLSLLFGGYAFWRHNTYCEPYTYSVFALCEYAVVACVMLFNGHYSECGRIVFGIDHVIMGKNNN